MFWKIEVDYSGKPSPAKKGTFWIQMFFFVFSVWGGGGVMSAYTWPPFVLMVYLFVVVICFNFLFFREGGFLKASRRRSCICCSVSIFPSFVCPLFSLMLFCSCFVASFFFLVVSVFTLHSFSVIHVFFLSSYYQISHRNDSKIICTNTTNIKNNETTTTPPTIWTNSNNNTTRTTTEQRNQKQKTTTTPWTNM